MNTCSWTGGSRNNEKKTAFKQYKRTINLFYTLVRLADPVFTEANMKHFFVSVLRNSKKRCLQDGPKRLSRMKRRPKMPSPYNSNRFTIYSFDDEDNSMADISGDEAYVRDAIENAEEVIVGPSEKISTAADGLSNIHTFDIKQEAYEL